MKTTKALFWLVLSMYSLTIVTAQGLGPSPTPVPEFNIAGLVTAIGGAGITYASFKFRK